jgi:tRNA threonylcarbamoyladenosine modification (KEOPS) complex  Pcc1 subunit
MLSLELRFEYPDAKVAETVMRSLDPDNGGYVETTLEGNVLRFNMSADNAGTLRNTADDLLACIKIAEETIGIGSQTSAKKG